MKMLYWEIIYIYYKLETKQTVITILLVFPFPYEAYSQYNKRNAGTMSKS